MGTKFPIRLMYGKPGSIVSAKWRGRVRWRDALGKIKSYRREENLGRPEMTERGIARMDIKY